MCMHTSTHRHIHASHLITLGQLSYLLQVARGKDGTASYPHPCQCIADEAEDRVSSPALLPLGLACLCPLKQGQS